MDKPNQSPRRLYYGHIVLHKLGNLWLAWNVSAIAHIAWSEADTRRNAALIDPATEFTASEVPEPYCSLLNKYSRGEAVEPARLPVTLVGTAFQQKVWRALRDIPRGEVRSYGQIASIVGSPGAARAVGTACRVNRIPIVVPCHRVVASGSRLGGYSGGIERKIALLELERLPGRPRLAIRAD